MPFLWRNGDVYLQLLKYHLYAVQTILNDISRASLFIIVILIVMVNNREGISSSIERSLAEEIG